MGKPENKSKKPPNNAEPAPTADLPGPRLEAGNRIEHFRIEREIGRGGAGVVYLAHDTKLGRCVAIKSLPPELMRDTHMRSRLKREAKLLASLDHPNIATIHDIVEQTESGGYLILEYIEGNTLAERITHRPLDLREVLPIAQQIAEAVAAAHEHGVTHRDLKPGNIKITPEGNVKVLDFGLAKAVAGEATDQQSTITEPGRVMGTPAYMSPEQARGQETDKRCDIWSFGCVVYEMLTGKVPFKGETVSDTLANVLQTEPNWQVLPESTPTNIVLLLRRCLEKEPRRRLRDIGDVAITLEETTIELQHPSLTKPMAAGPAKSTKLLRRALPWLITGTAMAILVLFAFIIGLKWGQPAEEQVGKAVSRLTAGPIKAIVVLPFENLSGDPEQEYFVDGMTDALSAELGTIKAIRVISRTSAMQYKDTDKLIPEIAKELGVDAVIEGSVLKAGSDVRITAQLIDGRTDAHLWSDNYTGTLTNILALQSQVTLAIARQIEAAVTPEEEVRIARTKSVNPEAYEAFLKSQFFYFKRTQAGHKTAIEYLEKAIDIDPNYAEAYARLAPAYWVPSVYGYTTPHEGFRKARWAADTAIGLDDSLSMAHRAAGWVALAYDWEWDKAKQKFNLARELNPNDPLVYESLAWYYVVAGRLEQAIEMIQTALKLDPLSLLCNHELAIFYLLSRQYEKAVEQHKNTLELDSNYLPASIELADNYMAMSKYSDAVTIIEKAMSFADRTSILSSMQARACALQGRKGEAQTLLAELEQKRDGWEKQRGDAYVSADSIAAVYVSLGDEEKALHWLNKAIDERSYMLLFLRHAWRWDPIRDNPEFNDLLVQMNFPEAPASESATESVETAQAPIKRIAVLPFTSYSRETDEEWFVDGMTDALIDQLGKIKALTVISRTSVMQYKNISKPMRQIAEDLGVDALIEGSVRRADNDVEIIARLIDGRTDERIWGDLFQDTFSNVLALQSQVTLAIAKKIEVALTPEEERRIARMEPVNPKAYEAYLLGRHYYSSGLEEDVEKGIKYFEKAIEIDSTYGLAYAMLADAYAVLGGNNILPPEDTWPNARSAAEKALAIDEGLAEAHASMAMVKTFYDWDWPGAEGEFKQALEINPNSVEARVGYSIFLRAMERHDEAVSQIERALELDPHSFFVKYTAALALYYAGHKNEAIQLAKNEIDSAPDQVNPVWYWCLGNLYAGQGRYEEALARIQTQIDLMKGDVSDELGFLGYLYGRLGRKADAQKQLEALDELAAKGRYVSPPIRSFVYIGLDDKANAFACLDEGCRTHSGWMIVLKVDFFFDTLRDDPRYRVLLKKMNLED